MIGRNFVVGESLKPLRLEGILRHSSITKTRMIHAFHVTDHTVAPRLCRRLCYIPFSESSSTIAMTTHLCLTMSNSFSTLCRSWRISTKRRGGDSKLFCEYSMKTKYT